MLQLVENKYEMETLPGDFGGLNPAATNFYGTIGSGRTYHGVEVNEIQFINPEHEKFYYECLNKSANNDVYHKSLFYTLGLTKETRRNINSLYDFKEHVIDFGGLNAPWHTSTTTRVVRLAFNLFNGFNGTDEKRKIDNPSLYTPYELFADELMGFFLQAVIIRFPNYWG